MTIEELRKGIREALEGARNIAAKAEGENRDLTEDEQGQVRSAIEKAQNLRTDLERKKSGSDLLKSLSDLGDGIGFEPQERRIPGSFEPAGDGASIGEKFVNSPEFKAFLAQFPGGTINEKARVQSAPVGFKTLLTGANNTTGAGTLVPSQRLGLVDQGTWMRPLTIRDIITVGQTGTDTVDYVKVSSVTNNAAPVPEATTSATPGVAGVTAGAYTSAHGAKPESAMAFVKASTTVKTIAHWVPATKRALADAGQLRTLIDGFLTYGLDEELEDQIVAGDGTGENFAGLANTSGVQTQAFATDLLTTYRKARTKVRTVGRSNPTAYLMNPADRETVDLLKDGNQQFYFGGPSGAGGNTLWGLPIVESEAVAAGTAYVGNFREMVLLDREQSSVTATDSHLDFFIRNLVAVLAELRAAFYIRRPQAIVKIALS